MQIFISPSLRAHFLLSVLARVLSPFRHCEGIYARGNPLHGASTATTPSSRLRLLRRYAPRNDRLHPNRHCEGIYARGNLLHGASTATTPSSCLRLLRRYAPRNDIVVSLLPNHLIITCPLKIVRKCAKCKYYASLCLNMTFSYKTDKFSGGAKIGHSEFSY